MRGEREQRVWKLRSAEESRAGRELGEEGFGAGNLGRNAALQKCSVVDWRT